LTSREHRRLDINGYVKRRIVGFKPSLEATRRSSEARKMTSYGNDERQPCRG